MALVAAAPPRWGAAATCIPHGERRDTATDCRAYISLISEVEGREGRSLNGQTAGAGMRTLDFRRRAGYGRAPDSVRRKHVKSYAPRVGCDNLHVGNDAWTVVNYVRNVM